MGKWAFTSSGRTPQQEGLAKASGDAPIIGFVFHRTTQHLCIFIFLCWERLHLKNS